MCHSVIYKLHFVNGYVQITRLELYRSFISTPEEMPWLTTTAITTTTTIIYMFVYLFIQVDIQDGELMALLEDAPVWGLPPLRPRLSRLLPRTRQSERVRATMMTRQQRQREGDQQRDPAQVCTLFWNRNHLMN